MPKPLDPVIEKFIYALDQSAGGIRGTILEIGIRGVLNRWLDREAVAIIKALQSGFSDKDRKGLWSAIQSGYCHDCARKLEDGEKCHCENEE